MGWEAWRWTCPPPPSTGAWRSAVPTSRHWWTSWRSRGGSRRVPPPPTQRAPPSAGSPRVGSRCCERPRPALRNRPPGNATGRVSSWGAPAPDYIHPTPHGGRCRVCVYLPEDEQDAPVFVCSELPTNQNSSITYAAEQLAAEAIHYHRLPTPIVW